MTVRVQAERFDIGAEITALTQGHTDIGGLCSFVGLVRDMNDGAEVRAMTLEHYPDMALEMLHRIEGEARARWKIDACLIIHRFGRLLPGDPIVLVVCAGAHRDAAFTACRFLMDRLKTDAPFWKAEEGAAGTTRWVAARTADDVAAAGWDDESAL